ncbi:type II toxin-antitoxin system VapC family toxin [Nannocystaceae bacterium ST9]
MTEVFVDTAYLVALLNPHDDLHLRAVELRAMLETCRLITSDLILGELLTYFGDVGNPEERSYFRKQAVEITRELLCAPEVIVESQTHDLFDAALSFYADRPDKGYSYVDCSSMVVMKRRGILEVATADHHFAQEGFLILLPRR